MNFTCDNYVYLSQVSPLAPISRRGSSQEEVHVWLKRKKPDAWLGCKHRMRNVVKLAMAWPAVALFATPGAAAGAAQPMTPYNPPSFHCQFVQFGNGQAPALTGYPQDPLCVEYDKRNITASNGGAVTFVLAEPTRFAIAVPKCQYWQLDHWSV